MIIIEVLELLQTLVIWGLIITVTVWAGVIIVNIIKLKKAAEARLVTGDSAFDVLSNEEKSEVIEAMKSGEEVAKKKFEALYSSTEKQNS